MSDTKEDESLSDLSNNESEKSSAENILPRIPDAVSVNQEKENMEVHHHPHVEKKNFKEYFLEFIMIFLAVALGFFAENIREHISDESKTKVFASSLYQDFKTDSVSIVQLITYTIEKIRYIDSLSYFMHRHNSRASDSNLYRSAIYLISTSPFDNLTGAYEQIKNTGSLRFFNQSLINNLNSYEATSVKLKQMEDWESKVLYEQVFPKAGEMFNFSVFDDFRNKGSISHDMYLRGANEESIDVLLNQANVVKHLRERQLLVLKVLLQKVIQILDTLKKEYHLISDNI